MKNKYLTLVLLVERMHRRFLDVIKAELEKQGVEDINNVQTLILYNIGDATLTVGELTSRGYYLGSNVSYNIKKLVENKYVIQERSPHDKRSIKVKLSEKGLKLCKIVDALYEDNATRLSELGLSESDLESSVETLKQIEALWSRIVAENFSF